MESFNHHRSLSITNIRRNLQLPVSCSNHRSQYRAIANQKPWNRTQAQWPALPFEVEEKRWRRHDKSRNECTLNFIDWHLKSRAPTEAKGALFLADKRAGDVVHIRLLPIPILSFSFILSLRSFVSSFHAVTFCIQKTDFSELRNGRRNLVGCEQQPLGRRFLFFFFLMHCIHDECFFVCVWPISITRLFFTFNAHHRHGTDFPEPENRRLAACERNFIRREGVFITHSDSIFTSPLRLSSLVSEPGQTKGAFFYGIQSGDASRFTMQISQRRFTYTFLPQSWLVWLYSNRKRQIWQHIFALLATKGKSIGCEQCGNLFQTIYFCALSLTKTWFQAFMEIHFVAYDSPDWFHFGITRKLWNEFACTYKATVDAY